MGTANSADLVSSLLFLIFILVMGFYEFYVTFLIYVLDFLFERSIKDEIRVALLSHWAMNMSIRNLK